MLELPSFHQAVEEKIKKLQDEEMTKAYASIASNYYEREDIHKENGISSFNEYVSRLMSGNDRAKEVENIKKETMDVKKKLNVVVQLRDEDQTNIGRYGEVVDQMQEDLKFQKEESKKLREIIDELESQISY